MALDSTPLLGPTRDTAAFAGADIYMAEVHNVLTPTRDGVECHFRGVALLVSLSDVPTDQSALRSLHDALAFARCNAFSGADWPEWLAKRVAAVQPEFTTAVLFIGCGADVVTKTVQATIDTLRRVLGTTLATVVVVCANADAHASLHGATGFVCGVTSTNAETAGRVFLAIASLQAPETLNGIDLLDLLPVLGPATAPTVLAEALWLGGPDGSLVIVSCADRVAIEDACRLVAVPFIRNWGWDGLRSFSSAMRKVAAAESDVTTFATNNALTAGLLPANVGWVPVLCLRHQEGITSGAKKRRLAAVEAAGIA